MEVAVVVDLAVQSDPDAAVLVGERLMATRDVDDAEPLGAQGHPAQRIEVDALVVGPAMTLRRVHLADCRAVRIPTGTADAATRKPPLPVAPRRYVANERRDAAGLGLEVEGLQ